MSETHWHDTSVTRTQREALNGHRGVILWYTGLSGSGKSTLANAVAAELHARGMRTYVLDGDNIRKGLNSGLGFSPQDRQENVRRVQEVARLFLDAGFVISACLISPYRSDRQRLRRLVADGGYIEIYCRASVAQCEQRDVKGLYEKARRGLVSDFTGVTAPYEEPDSPELVVDTGSVPLQQAVEQVLEYLARRGICKDGTK